MEPNFKILDVLVPFDDAPNVLTKEVWPIIRPQWMGKEIISKTFAAGYVNYTTLFYVADDTQIKDGLIVRLYESSHQVKQNNLDEFIFMQIAHHAGVFPAVQVVLGNGLVYGYMPGHVLTHANISDPQVGPRVARALAKLNWVDMMSVRLKDRAGQPICIPMKENFIKRMREVLKETEEIAFHPDETDRANSLINRRELEEEITFAEQYLAGLDFPTANTHDDFHVYNIIYDDESGNVGIVDYEMSGYHGPATCDLSFILDMGVWNAEIITRYTHYKSRLHYGRPTEELLKIPIDGTTRLPISEPFLTEDDADRMPSAFSSDILISAPGSIPEKSEPDESKLRWITAYLQQKHELEGRSGDDLSEGEVELWFTMLQITDVLMYLLRMPILLTCMQRTLRSGFLLSCYEVAHQVYFERKPMLASLREKYLRLKKSAPCTKMF